MWRACLSLVIAFASGCHIVFPIEPLDSDGGTGDAPSVYSSPQMEMETVELWGGFAGSFTLTLAADQPGTTIYYTTDGAMPTTSSPSAQTPVRGITIATPTMVRYFGVQGGARSAVASETFPIDTAKARANAGYLVTATTLDGNSPVVITTPGATLTGRANVQTWVQSNCATCGAQVVYGVDKVDQGCLFDGAPGAYPGMTMNAKTFTVKAPLTPGVHEVQVAHIEQTNCGEAMAMNTLQIRPTRTRIAVIIVR